METFLMCSPDHYDVDYVINPWMNSNVHKVDKQLATHQWTMLKKWLEDRGAKVFVLPQQPHLPDQVFAANFGVSILGTSKIVISNFSTHQRRPESEFITNWCSINGTRTLQPIFDPKTLFEGGGDAIFDKFLYLWMGFGFRTDFETVDLLRKHVSNVVPLKLVDPRFYHLDTCFKPLPMGEYLYYPDAFDDHSQWILKRYNQTKLIAVDEDDACRFACNAVNVKNDIFVNDMSNQLKEKLEGLGYNVTRSSLSEFVKSGGSAACLTMYLGDW